MKKTYMTEHEDFKINSVLLSFEGKIEDYIHNLIQINPNHIKNDMGIALMNFNQALMWLKRSISGLESN